MFNLGLNSEQLCFMRTEWGRMYFFYNSAVQEERRGCLNIQGDIAIPGHEIWLSKVRAALTVLGLAS